MRIFFTAIFVFFIFGNANAIEKNFEKEIMIKGEVVAYFFEEGARSDTKTIVMRYQGEVYECKIFADNFSCSKLRAF